MRKLIGVVLCGGQSTRMGTDKGLLDHNSMSFAATALSKLEAVVEQVVLSVNSQQYSTYSAQFPQQGMVKDEMNVAAYGPIKGILSVHLQYPAADLLVLACDMPSMHTNVLRSLIDTSDQKEEDAFVYLVNEQVEPLCGIYTAKGMAKIYQRSNHGQLRKNSMHYILEQIQTCYLPGPKEWIGSFKNYNSRDDLNS